MSTELGRIYELLGVKPGSSVAELKAAHRDMAKVWHPDRFGHDPRLQKKAQEKLKEINEAFDILISGKVPRPQAGPRYEQPPVGRSENSAHVRTDIQSMRSDQKQSARWQWVALPLLIFVAVFGLTIRQLLNRQAATVQLEAAASESSAQEAEVGNTSKSEVSRGNKETNATVRPAASPEIQPASAAEIQPLPTVTVMIDPSTGLLARSDCPSKTRMTYPGGNEPHDYCGADHPQKTQSEVVQETSKDSRVKSLTKKIVTRLNAKEKPDGWSQQNQ